MVQSNGENISIEGNSLSSALSQEVFSKTGQVEQIIVTLVFRYMLNTLLIILALIIVLTVAIGLFIAFNPQFGAKPDPIELEKFANSPQWNGKIFENQIETSMDMGASKIPGVLYKQLFDRKGRAPEKPIPSVPFDEAQWAANDEPKFIWYGHSVVLLKINGKTLLIDPMLGPNAAPVAPFKIKRFSEDTLKIIDQLPKLNAILITLPTIMTTLISPALKNLKAKQVLGL